MKGYGKGEYKLKVTNRKKDDYLMADSRDTRTWGRNIPCHKPSQWELDNAPAQIQFKATIHNKKVDAYWCYSHGMFFTDIPVIERNEKIYPDLINCRCPKCISEGVYTTGHKYEG